MLVIMPITASTTTNSTKLRPRCRAVDLRGNDLGVTVMAKGSFGLSGGRVCIFIVRLVNFPCIWFDFFELASNLQMLLCHFESRFPSNL